MNANSFLLMALLALVAMVEGRPHSAQLDRLDDQLASSQQ